MSPPMLRGKKAGFVAAYIVSRNATRAAIEAGYSPRSAHVQGPVLLENPDVRQAIAASNKAIQESAHLTVQDIAAMWVEAATTDRNELMEVRRHCCRYCWGIDHLYQETPQERRNRQADYERLKADTKDRLDWPPIQELGGVGYDRRKDANPDCPECWGDGTMLVLIRDTRKLSPAARNLYEGAKITKDGIELRIMERSKALENLAKHLGMLDDHSTNLNLNVDADAIPDDPTEAARAYQRLTSG